MGKIEDYLKSQGIDVPEYENSGNFKPLDIEANIEEVKQYSLTHNPFETGQWFKEQVGNKKRWDFKQIDPKFEAFGNIHYGIVGEATGFPRSILFSAAGAAQLTSNWNLSFNVGITLDFLNGVTVNSIFITKIIFSFHSGHGFGLADNLGDAQNILFGMNVFDDFYPKFSNPIFDSFINKATSYANKFFAQSSARNLGHIPMILINHDICSLCGVCVSACQKEILEIKGGIIQINFKNMEENGTCDGCVACIGFCPEEAIEIY